MQLPRRSQRRDQGFTLIELVVAMVVLGAMAAAVIGVIMTAQTKAVSNRNRVAAANLASRELDLVREQFATKTGPLELANAGLAVNPHHLPGGTDGQPLVVDGTGYTVRRSAQWNVGGNGASACEGGSLVSYPTLGVTVTVSWPNMGSTKPVVSTAQLAPPKKMGVATTDAFIASKVVDQDGKALSGMAVSATGGSVSTGYTDASGCAVIQVTPVAAGTVYTLRVVDSAYVDISSTPNPSKITGLVQPGTISSGADFTVGRAGTVTVRLVREDDVTLTDAQVAGSTITLVASQYSGASGATTKVVTGVTTTFTGMWPTTYGAYFGTTAPTTGYKAAPLPGGGSVQIDAKFEMARVEIDTLPAGAQKVFAYPSAAATKTCASGTGFSEVVSGVQSHLVLLPGKYDLFVQGTGYACSPGPTGVVLTSGDNDEQLWGTQTLRLTSVPAGGKVWAVDKALISPSTLTTCPTSLPAGAVALDVDAARNAPMDLPAGNWYVWLSSDTDVATAGTCLSYPDLISAVSLFYKTPVSRAWAASPLYATLTVTGIPASRFLLVSTSSTMTCSATTTTPSGASVLQAGPTGASGGNLFVTNALRPTSGTTTYYAYIWNKSSGSTNKCSGAGSFLVKPGTTSLTKDTGGGQVQ
ncbi:hypothetical protein Cch01nite_11070 [Cellulomonas chitinilytica]|uniref:Prepilin-type N-terminal cleavage/methylation domain-containing protein n=1 Tax=Cellulomonas chitinilytica TaxID=398759 RepID=A0A919P1X7_9CELL|nr:type II secretion system protein [Cellulomonas chitinilytica]GIG20383.1 hypothetical protein Cch01nite_11070 [Cellulomonas chitinilytica]